MKECQEETHRSKPTATNVPRDMALIAELLAVPADGRYPALAVGPQQKREITLTALLNQLDGVAAQGPFLIELCEINYGGSTEEIRRCVLFGPQAIGTADKLEGFAETCMAEYDLDGWTVPDLTNPGPLSHHAAKGQAASGGGGNPLAARSSIFGKGGDYPGGFRNPFADK